MNFKNPHPTPSSPAHYEHLSGTIERVTYHNPDNGFCVLRIKVKGKKDLVTVTGNSPSALPGEYIKCSGVWFNDKTHGLQFKASFLKALPPESLSGIEKYLGSGLIKGIGPHFAKKLVELFKEEVFDVIESKPHLLTTVENIGKKRAASICSNWQAQKVIREIMVFLQSHGVGTLRATRIYKTYGDKSIEVVSQNPYKLAEDIRGIGFVSADTIAGNLGIKKDSLIRASAGLSHALLEATSEGHCGLPENLLIQSTCKLLEINEDLVTRAIELELQAGIIVRDTISIKLEEKNDIYKDSSNSSPTPAIFLSSFYTYEKYITKFLSNLLNKNLKLPWDTIDADTTITWLEQNLNIKLASVQKEALSKAITTKVMVITGGPGTGKTTLVNSIITTLNTKELDIKLCAPTGRAAKRLSESTGIQATTIHRLLCIDPNSGKFKYNKDNKLPCDYLVIDEASMVDVQLFYQLLQAIPESSALLIVGDVDQLPSVGAGQVLKDIIDSKAIEVVKLTEIFRQSLGSNIIKSAYLVNKGYMPVMEDKNKSGPQNPLSDFYFIEAELGEDILNKIIKLVKERIPLKFNLNPVRDIQILTPMQRGGVGARSLNIELQKVLNPHYTKGIEKYGQIYAPFDKVMQTENDYDKEVYNGDIGTIKQINDIDQEVVITFDDKDITYDYSDLDQITLSYATTIHKSQGSEYPAVIIPVTMQSYMMLRRNLIYTAITRGKKLVIVIGQKKALQLAIRNKESGTRYTKLKEWMMA